MLSLLGILVVVAALLALWARWLSRRPGAPGFVRHLQWVVFLPPPVGVGITTLLLSRAFEGATRLAASDRTHFLSKAIARAMHATLVAGGSAMVTAALLLVLTWRHHWSRQAPGAGTAWRPSQGEHVINSRTGSTRAAPPRAGEAEPPLDSRRTRRGRSPWRP